MVENIKQYRAVALLCRQQAALRPEANWQWLAEAERYEHLADAEIAVYFKECNGVSNSTPSLRRPDVSLPDLTFHTAHDASAPRNCD